MSFEESAAQNDLDANHVASIPLLEYSSKEYGFTCMGFESDVEELFTKTCTETVCFYQENVLWSEFTEQRKRQLKNVFYINLTSLLKV